MGSKIGSTGVALGGGMFNKKSLNLVVKAARESIDSLGVDPDDIGLLVNTGIFRDKNISEPSNASFIQRKIGANPLFDGERSTFSFDILNGGCGLITGMQLIDTFISSGQIDKGIVVTSDANPDPGLTKGFDYKPAAAAIILEGSDGDSVFRAFRSYTYPEYKNDFDASISFEDRSGKKGGGKPKGRNILDIVESEKYAENCVKCASKSLEVFLSEMKLSMKDIDLIIPSQSPEGFIDGIIKKTKIDSSRIIDVSGAVGKIHTAGPGIALKKAMDDGSFSRAERIIFLAVGAGITVSIALYGKK
jgi:3-oxoacyl-[acyl-carrier-protein] synthase-3